MTAQEFAQKFEYQIIGTMVECKGFKDAEASLMICKFKESGGFWVLGDTMVTISSNGCVMFPE